MENNDILRRVRFAFDLSDSQMIEMFKLADYNVTRAEISDWLKKDEDPAFQQMNDSKLALFLNGFIIDKRGKKEGPTPPAESMLNNNIVFRKLKIALSLDDTGVLEILELANMKISKHELSALFRSPTSTQYRRCNDQILRNFLHGLQLKYRQK